MSVSCPDHELVRREECGWCQIAAKIDRAKEANEERKRPIPGVLWERRRVLIAYAQSRLEVQDWHAVSDAANDLRELDVEIRLTK